MKKSLWGGFSSSHKYKINLEISSLFLSVCVAHLRGAFRTARHTTKRKLSNKDILNMPSITDKGQIFCGVFVDFCVCTLPSPLKKQFWKILCLQTNLLYDKKNKTELWRNAFAKISSDFCVRCCLVIIEIIIFTIVLSSLLCVFVGLES